MVQLGAHQGSIVDYGPLVLLALTVPYSWTYPGSQTTSGEVRAVWVHAYPPSHQTHSDSLARPVLLEYVPLGQASGVEVPWRQKYPVGQMSASAPCDGDEVSAKRTQKYPVIKVKIYSV